MTEARSPKKVCARLGMGLFLMMLCWLVAMYVAQLALMTWAPHLLQSMWVIWMLNDLPLYAVGLPVFLLVLRTVPDGPPAQRQKMQLKPWQLLLILIFCFGATYLFNFASVLVQMLLQWLATGQISELNSNLEALVGGGSMLANFLFGVCVPALGEEFIFRYTIRRKMRGCADSTYIFFNGFVFALFHASLSQMLYAFVIGALFAWLYVITDNIWLPVALHFIINLFGIILAPLADGNQMATILMGGFVILMIIGAIIIFGVCFSWVSRTFAPPQEAGWPYRAKAHRVVYPYAYPQQQQGYGYPPQGYGYAPQGGYAPPYAPPPPYAPGQPAGQAPPPAAPGQPTGQPPQQPGGYGAPAQAAPQYGYAQPVYPQPPPAYPQPSSGYPTPGGAPPYAEYPPAQPLPQYYMAPGPQPRIPRQPGAVRLCLGNVGMVLYLVLVGIVTLASLLVSIGVI